MILRRIIRTVQPLSPLLRGITKPVTNSTFTVNAESQPENNELLLYAAHKAYCTVLGLRVAGQPSEEVCLNHLSTISVC